ncbi:SDR family oxidoreductase [Baekduia soli]|uniref:SDR family oxidoreductase n=1 Tax=Baekduia soli TaxID=496014 RepID=A0A5B8U2Q5_9ACTN|nr:SDR family oxidoreductase [Baekduia soli]QEC47240.1 SDR family oxidoreductase [Baekduia soli]
MAAASEDPTAGGAGRVVLVTGGSRGLGRAIVGELAGRGLNLCFTYREQEQAAEEVAAQARAAGADTLVLRYDQARDDAQPVVDAILERWGRLDGAILNAGMWAGGRIDELDPEAWWNVVEIDLGGVYRCVRAAVPVIRRSPEGSIVLMSSMVGIAGFPGDTAYASAKAGLVGLGKSLARELARDGTRVNILAPGFVESDANASVSPRARERLLALTLLGRFGRAEEIARAAVFLSEEATYMTGAVLNIDGGVTT